MTGSQPRWAAQAWPGIVPAAPARPPRFVRQYLADHPGNPLGRGFPVGSTLRGQDGTTHREGWARIVRGDPCSYCGEAGGTNDHIEAKSDPRPTPAWGEHRPGDRGLGGAHSWLNYAGACEACNFAKDNMPMLAFLLQRARHEDRRRRRAEARRARAEAVALAA